MKNNIFIAIVLILFCIAIIVSQYINEKIQGSKQCFAFGNIKNIEGLFSCGCFDIWHISHFLFWLLLGSIVPDKYRLVIILSVTWELWEHFYYKNHIKGCSGQFCARVEDVFLNLAGYTVGSYYLSGILLKQFPFLTKG